MQKHVEEQQADNKAWMDEEGVHIINKGVPPSPEEQARMTKDYQNNIKNSPMWEIMLKEYGAEKAEEMLKEFQVQIK